MIVRLICKWMMRRELRSVIGFAETQRMLAYVHADKRRVERLTRVIEDLEREMEELR